MEEMDLLIQWLESTSSATQAKNIRNANTEIPDQGLKPIWDCLLDGFANPEVVESAISRKVANLSKLEIKDNARLHELLDIV